MAEAPAEIPGRPMKYPYTFSAKIAQFPLKYHIKNNWIWRYYLIAVGVSIPIFYKIDRLGKYLELFPLNFPR
jgi:hypothetical protein